MNKELIYALSYLDAINLINEDIRNIITDKLDFAKIGKEFAALHSGDYTIVRNNAYLELHFVSPAAKIAWILKYG